MIPADVGGHTAPPGESNTFLPEESTTFRLARMLLLLDVAKKASRRIQSLDRLGYYEFFADNPFIVVEGSSQRDEADRTTLKLVGFSQVQLAYASAGHRFVSRRRRLQHDLALLVAYGLATLTNNGYVITDSGTEMAAEFQSVYADAYKKSSEIILRRLAGMSNKGLEIAVESWFGHPWLLLDLLDDVTDAVVPQTRAIEKISDPNEGELS
ncbi:hypothetical protein ACFWAY_22265 [Rhodococcus sp. NPDC059968]|uniref:hypothetical protein n=1 Tax=Rhodococcus sp. NPDC059968 TaxID=3347017 RepID=UPI003670174A